MLVKGKKLPKGEDDQILSDRGDEEEEMEEEELQETEKKQQVSGSPESPTLRTGQGLRGTVGRAVILTSVFPRKASISPRSCQPWSCTAVPTA